MHRTKLVLAVTLAFAGGAVAQESPDGALYYAVEEDVTMYQTADSTRPYISLGFREPVFLVSRDDRWAEIRTGDGARGLVRPGQISNIWIRISKKSQTLYIYRGEALIQRLPADLGYNFFSDKVQRGAPGDPDHWRTPNGVFHVVRKNPDSQYHRAFVLNYPNGEDARRGLRDSLITQSQFAAILSADSAFAMPPMDTPLGGWIEIHGEGTGRRDNWTQGCIAVENDAIDRLWDWVHVGTPVVIDP
jgi:lipoprotein-anchoring transpeptidase ErfK/SrfK